MASKKVPAFLKGPKEDTSAPMPKGNGYPAKGVKTSGVKARGRGAATKGFTSRGPMA